MEAALEGLENLKHPGVLNSGRPVGLDRRQEGTVLGSLGMTRAPAE